MAWGQSQWHEPFRVWGERRRLQCWDFETPSLQPAGRDSVCVYVYVCVCVCVCVCVLLLQPQPSQQLLGIHVLLCSLCDLLVSLIFLSCCLHLEHTDRTSRRCVCLCVCCATATAAAAAAMLCDARLDR